MSGEMGEKYKLEVFRGNEVFGNKLYEVLSKEDGNVFFSPISAHAVLAMAYQGAGGSTAEALANTLNVPPAACTAEGYKELLTYLNRPGEVTLLMANNVFIRDNLQLLDTYKEVIQNCFFSDVKGLNFEKNTEAANTINSWVEEKTNRKIRNLIKPESINALTRLILVNAIYFKGRWEKVFSESLTKTEQFWINDNDCVDVQMMHHHTKLLYNDNKSLNAKILKLPYTNPCYHMLIILPNTKNGLKDVENKLMKSNISSIMHDLENAEVTLALPRFKVEKTINLKSTLTEVGLGEIFDMQKANFKGIISNDELFVSEVVQKAFVEVNEQGAEAAAATFANFRVTCCRPVPLPKVDFIVDHPFIFMINETSYDHVATLFYGRNSNPTN